MAVVTLDRITKRYEEKGQSHTAVREISLTVPDHEFLVLVGPSGCGKSTLLRMIAGLEDITEGRVLIDGRDVTDVPAQDRNIAMVFQNYALYPHMTVYENLAFALRLRKAAAAEIDTRVREAAGMLGLEDLLERKPRQLSGGQRQRVAVGRAIVRQPQVFLFDEPLSNLDAKLRLQTRRELAALRRRLGTTTVYVTHDQVEAMTLGDRIAVMHQGEVRQVGTPMEVFARPADTFVAQFIGSPPINLLQGALEAGPAFRVVGAAAPLPLAGLPVPPGATNGAAFTLGIRPEALQLRPAGTPGLEALVEEIEALGNETMVGLTCGNIALTARLAAADALPQRGERVVCAASAVHWFDSVSGRRLDAPA